MTIVGTVLKIRVIVGHDGSTTFVMAKNFWLPFRIAFRQLLLEAFDIVVYRVVVGRGGSTSFVMANK